MKIKWYGHAAFRLETNSGVRIIVDPYESGAFGGALSYGKITDEADIVLTSHDHADHNHTKEIKGKFRLLSKKGVYEEKGVKIRALPSYHDSSKGKERGDNLIFIIEAEGLTVMHAGDLGHRLDKKTLAEIGTVDVLFLPVGGFYTIDAEEAAKVMGDIHPAVTIPMHFKTAKCDFPITGAEEFTRGKKGVKQMSASEIDIKKEALPREPEIIVLKYAL